MLDIFILVVLAWALISGWRHGLIKEIASTIGFLFGLFIAATCYSAFGSYLSVNGSEGNMITSVVAFFILWICAPIVLGLVANVLTKCFKHTIIGAANSLGGAIVSVLKFSILLGCILSAMSALHILNEERTAESRFYGPMKGVFSSVVNWAITPKDDTQSFTPADKAATANDTVWVDVKR